MPQNIFKIYDGRNYFWQWDTNQKLIVLDETVDEVHFSHKDMKHAIVKDVCTDKDGLRVCHIPDALLTLPKNLIATAYVTDDGSNRTIRTVKFGVRKRLIPSDYIVTEDFAFADFDERLSMIEDIIEDSCFVHRFNTLEEAERWANESKDAGAVISVKNEDVWITYVVAEDYSIVRICDCDKEVLISAIERLQKLVGETSVDAQIKTAINDLDLPNTYETKGVAEQMLVNAKEYTDARAKDYDSAGAAHDVQLQLNEEIARAKNEEAAITNKLVHTNTILTNVSSKVEDVDEQLADLVDVIKQKSDSDHSHNDIYYTENEIDNLLSVKSDVDHNHDASYDVNGAANNAFNAAKQYTDNVVSNMISNGTVDNKILAHDTSDSSHVDIRKLIGALTEKVNHFLDSEANNADQISEIIELIDNLQDVMAAKSDNNHVHDDRYYTEAETNVLLDGKSNIDHNHNNVYDAKGSANEALILAQNYADNAVSDKSHINHVHDDIYYTEDEIDKKMVAFNSNLIDLEERLEDFANTGDMTIFEAAKTYIDLSVTQKSQVQIITWEADD
jgi:hypothetical protein